MARFVIGMNISLDGYVDHERFAPDEVLFREWIAQVEGASAAIYGRKVYELMRYWDEDQPDWTEDHQAFATAIRKLPKWVVSSTLTSVGPNTTLISGDVEATIQALKDRLSGEVDISGTVLAASLGKLGLIDEYRLFYHPVVLGHGRPFFTAALPRLRFVGSDKIGDEAIRVTCVPA